MLTGKHRPKWYVVLNWQRLQLQEEKELTFNCNVQGRLMEGQDLKLGFNKSVNALEVGGLGWGQQKFSMCDLLKSSFCFHSLFSVSYLVTPSSASRDPNQHTTSWSSHRLLHPNVESSMGSSCAWVWSLTFSWCLDHCFALKMQMMEDQHQGSVEIYGVGVGGLTT